MATISEMMLAQGGALASTQTRAHHKPAAGMTNISLDFNAAPSGTARGTEVIVPDSASPELRAAAEAYNQAVVQFAANNGIAGYPNRGVKTRSENGRGVAHTVHTEPFFNSDGAMQKAIQANPQAFAAIYRDAFGGLANTRIIPPHGVGADRGAASDFFGNETAFGKLMIESMLAGGKPMRGAGSDHANTMMAAGVDPGLAHAASAQSPAATSPSAGGGIYSSSTPGSVGQPMGSPSAPHATEFSNADAKPQQMTQAQRMAAVGQSLMALDSGDTDFATLATALHFAKDNPLFTKKRGFFG